MPTYTNRWNNSQLTGTVVGVIGSGGVAPTGWNLATTGGGLTVTNEVTSFATTAGQTVIRFKITLSNTSGSDQFPAMQLGDIASLSGSTLYQWAVWLRSVSFTPTGTVYFEWLGTNQYTSGFSFVQQDTNQATLGATLIQKTGSRTTQPTTGIVQPYIGWGLTNGSSFVSEFEVAQGMWVQGSWLPSYIPTTSSTPVSRDVVSFRGHNKTYLEM